ncbi:tetratricopeptide repeat protein [Dictyobacter kobayashii]|uniref:Bacterial transcriptional activator domain-containing protein n=1 Tax=Dictyobacter kobayashii TaxID=2014872 RepID=A0A402AC35_9CHLR|nr:tetratricopeptide repeat protein [Dictyobacter kobayashii]GCE16653.1 hypothetical protein KDK_04530 [Dictyobacter kobayashii]
MAQITLRDYLQEIEDAISSKRVDEALASCQYVLAFFPESLEAQRLLGEVYLAQGKLEDAQQAFDWVLTNDPENVVAYCSRALVSEQMSDYDTALDCYQQAYELSRGNGQIRQAFNQLSEKAGQQGFMFSRAGLARLYMRGDLLSQASQEWDMVLAMSPDRLDARTGLLEVYWRQGLNDRAAQLAEQILQDVPGCIKALLLLAYVTAPQDMLRSKELVKQVEAFDPDLVMAHDLFADHLANRAGDPFLKLLSKAPATLGAADAAAKTTASQTANAFTSSSVAGGSVSSNALAGWGSNAAWNNDETLVKPRSNQTPAQADASSLPSWMSGDLTPGGAGISNSGTSSWGGESWGAMGNSPAQPQAAAASDQSDPAEPWQLLQNALHSISPETVKQASDPGLADPNATPWLGGSGLEASETAIPDTQDTGLPADDRFSQEPDQSWSFDIPEGSKNNAAVPAWLNMLTRNERQPMQDQPESVTPSVENPPVAAEPFSAGPVPQPQAEPEPPVAPPAPAQPAVKPSTIAESASVLSPGLQSDGDGDSEEESFFGPDWLKSLGAASLDGTGAYNFSELAEQQPAAQKSSGASWEQAPAQRSSGASWEQPAAQKSSGASWEQHSGLASPEASVQNQKNSGALREQPVEQPRASSSPSWEQVAEQPSSRKSSGASWSQPEPAIEQPKAQAFYDPSWLLESPSQAKKKNSSPSWEQPQVEEQPEANSVWEQVQSQPSVSQPGESALNQLAEESQNAPSENDPWAAWQAAYAPSQQLQQPVENQDYWSSSQPTREPETSEQPSWMQQLSQSSSNASNQASNTGYDDWAAAYATPTPETSAPQPDQAWQGIPSHALSSEEPEQPRESLSIERPEPEQPAVEDPWAMLNQQMQSQNIDYDWLAQLAGGNQRASTPAQPEEELASKPIVQPESQQAENEQNLVTTLEELEQKLLSHGFTPLEPNSLASIAQSQEEPQLPESPLDVVADNKQQVEKPEPSLSSALAELGNFFPRPAEPASVEPLADEPQAPASWQPQAPAAEPSWLAALGAVPIAPAAAAQIPEQPVEEVIQSPVIAEQPVMNAPVEPPATPPLPAETPFQPLNREAAEPMPTARMNPLLDSGLETTMKRPAVRLQPMQQRAAVRETGIPTGNRNRAGERAGQRVADSGGNVSHRERLIRGYQAQLIGDFDNAMQEYRVIIRNAPELLGEVVSNVRALLKLAPNYSAGYRVLGDAYMRQGEYLQAMEAYNKALTMAKKAKG